MIAILFSKSFSMAYVNGITQLYLPLTHLSTGGTSHLAFIPRPAARALPHW